MVFDFMAEPKGRKGPKKGKTISNGVKELQAWIGISNGEREEPKKRKTIPKAVKVTVWNKYIGATQAEGKCYVCGRTIHVTDFDLGHNKAKARGGGDDISNLRPICRTCNLSMGTQSIESFKAKHFSKPKSGQKELPKKKRR